MRLLLQRTALAACLACFGLSGAARFAEAASPVVVAQMSDDDTVGGPPVDDPNSAAALTVRVDRLENTIRSLTGQIEQLQFQNRKLTDDLRKMQQDVDFRFQDLGHGAGGAPQKRTSLDPSGPTPDGVSSDTGGGSSAPVSQRRTSDAFDPNADPNAPGAPRQLGTTTPSAPLNGRRDAAAAPLDLMRRTNNPPADQSTENGVAPIRPDAAPDMDRPVANPNAVASLTPGGTREEYNADLDLYRQGQYDSAATGLKSFLDKYPRDRMVPDAVYLLGETYTKLGRNREAAEQYLRLSTDYSKAPRAPDALLRLGIALNAMGVREQACATYQEVNRRFPSASPELKASVDRELKKARC